MSRHCMHTWVRRRLRRPAIGVAAAALVAAGPLLGACSSSHSEAVASAAASSGGATSAAGARSAAGNSEHPQLAFFAFAVQNDYEAPMIAAARQEAAAENAQLTVFAQDNAQTQFGEVQDAIVSGKYDGFLIDAVDGAGLVPLVQQALSQHIKVVAVNDVLGANLQLEQPQIPGVSASVVYTAFSRGQHGARLVEQACAAAAGSGQCNVGYMYDFKASEFDQGVRAGLDSVISSDPRIKIVAEGQAEFSATQGFAAAETMLQAQPDITVLVGSDQGMEGATRAVAAAGKTGHVKIIGLGGSVAAFSEVKSGAWFGDVATLPATQGQVAAQALVKAIRQGVNSGGLNPAASLPDGGLVTQADVSQFTGQWSG